MKEGCVNRVGNTWLVETHILGLEFYAAREYVNETFCDQKTMLN